MSSNKGPNAPRTHAPHAHVHPRASVAQPKSPAGFAQNVLRPAAPPAYRPQPVLKVLQTKSALPQRPAAPLPPQRPAPVSVQPKMTQAPRTPVANVLRATPPPQEPPQTSRPQAPPRPTPPNVCGKACTQTAAHAARAHASAPAGRTPPTPQAVQPKRFAAQAPAGAGTIQPAISRDKRIKAKKKYKDSAKREKVRRLGDKFKYGGLKRGEEIIKVVSGQSGGYTVKVVNGKVTFTRSKTGGVYQLMVSTTMENFGGKVHYKKTDKWKHYSQWASVLDTHNDRVGVAKELVRHFLSDKKLKWSGPALTERQSRAASALLSALMVSEPYRRDGAGKFARAALRAVAEKGHTFSQVFAGKDPMFTLAGSKGCNNWDAISTNKTELPTDNETLLTDYLSDSEDEL